jgi:hypothetical protein
MGMGIMQNNPVLNAVLKGQDRCSLKAACGVVLFALFPVMTQAANWTIDPSLLVRESYTDNVDLDSSDEESAFITEISPQVSIKGEGGRLKLNFNYRLQNILRSNGDEGNSTNHQLQADALAELIENLFFLDVNGSMGQANNSSTGRRSGDNISGSGNRNDFWTAGFSPYITPHLNGYVDGEIRYRFNTIHSDGDNVSNSDIHEQIIGLRSGSRFSKLTWSFNHTNREQKRDESTSDDTQFRNTSGEIRLGLTREFSVFVQAGNYQSDFAGDTGSNSQNNNGSYTTYGGAWTPSRRFSIEGGVGERNSFVTVNVAPTTRTSWITTFRDSDVGTNTGETWNTALSLRTRRTTWQVTYFEDVSTYQQTLLDQQIFNVFNNNGQLLGQIPLNVPTAIDEVFTRQRGELSFTGNTGKSTVNIRAYTEKRRYQESGNNQDVLGWNASWNWRVAAKTNSILSFRWQKTEGDEVITAGVPSTTNSDETYKSTSLRINRSLSPDADANIEFLRTDQSSDDSTNDYVENRITAGITVRF